MLRRPAGRLALQALAALSSVLAAPAQAPARSELYVIENVRLAPEAEPVGVVLSEGRIERWLAAGAERPPGARAVDGDGGLLVPAFVDAYARAGLETPVPAADRDVPVPTESDVRVDMRAANRRGIQTAFRAVDALALGEKDAEGARAQGFGTLCIAPAGHLLPGASAVVTSRSAAARDTVLVPAAFEHAELRPSEGGYPSTLMGCMAQLRQFFLDAGRQRTLRERQAAGRPGPRPPYDAELEAILPVLDGLRPLACQAESHRDIERWIRLADEFGFQLVVTGGRDAWRVADVLAEREIPVVLTLDWGDEVDDPNAKQGKAGKRAPDEPADEPEEGRAEEEGAQPAAEEPGAAEGEEPEADESRWEYLEPLAVRAERRRLWEETRDCALRLHEAGVRFAFGTGGGSPQQLLKRVRALVEAGLPSDVALAALTSGGAELLGLGDRLGALEPGMLASLAVWTGDPTTEEAKLAWLFVDGFPHEFELEDQGPGGAPDEGVEASGTWTIEQEEMGETSTSTAVLEMTPEGEVTGTLTRSAPGGSGTLETQVTGSVQGHTLALKGSFQLGDMDVSFSMKGELDGDSWSGRSTVKGPWGELERSFEARREPESNAHRLGGGKGAR